MKIEMKRSDALSLVNEVGPEGFIEFMNSLASCENVRLGLYSCSKDWVRESSFNCKLKGAFGDLLITWDAEIETDRYASTEIPYTLCE